jgi:Carboxypeptidase regulatory-like domain
VVKNHAQPFLKVSLPAGATIVSVEVAGQPAKPVTGDDGTRVPLLRPGFRPSGQYIVSFVYLLSGTPFGRKGDVAMTLPFMDIPVGLVQWEVFAPEKYSLRYVDGNAVTQQTLEHALTDRTGPRVFFANPSRSALNEVGNGRGIVISLAPGEGSGRVRGMARDSSGAVLPGVTIEIGSGSLHFAAVTAADGSFLIVGVPQGIATITATIPGFQTASASFVVGNVGHMADIEMRVGSLEESVTVSGNSPRVGRSARAEADQKTPPSQNVINLQRRIVGVLPVRVDVPRAGTSYRFSRPLVVDDETHVSFHYKRK